MTDLTTAQLMQAAKEACEVEGCHGVDLELGVEPSRRYPGDNRMVVTTNCCYCRATVTEAKVVEPQALEALALGLVEQQDTARAELLADRAVKDATTV